METSRLRETLDGCLDDIIKCHKNGENITFHYDPANRAFFKVIQRDIEDICYVEKEGKKYYFMENIVNNSAWRDCDVQYTYTPIEHKPFYSREEILERFEKEGVEFINSLR